MTLQNYTHHHSVYVTICNRQQTNVWHE